MARGVVLLCFCGGVSLAAATPVEAANERFFVYDDPINGAVPAESEVSKGLPGWLTARISNRGNGPKDPSRGVLIELSSKLTHPSEFIGNVGFNLSDSLDAAKMPKIDEITCSVGAQVCQGFSSIYGKPNAFSVNGGQAAGGKVSGFDLGLVFAANALSGSTTMTIKVIGDVTADLFDQYDNQPSGGGALTGLRTAAKVQGIQSGAGSGEIAGTDPPPDQAPGPLPVLGVIAAFRATRRLRRRLTRQHLCHAPVQVL
jgi:hypothetical protein